MHIYTYKQNSGHKCLKIVAIQKIYMCVLISNKEKNKKIQIFLKLFRNAKTNMF